MRHLALLAATALLFLGAVPAAQSREVPRLVGDTVFLPNLDDDARRCRVDPADLDAPGGEVDERLAACHDAADEVVNGQADAADLARVRLRPMTGVGETARATVTASTERVRLFLVRGKEFEPLRELTAEDLRRGVQLAVEGKDVVRDPAGWDGTATITVSVPGHGVARHVLRQAPLLLQHDLQRAEQVFLAAPGDAGEGWPADGPWQLYPGTPGEYPSFAGSLARAARQAGLSQRDIRPIVGSPGWWKDMWAQDTFEPAYVSMPAPHGVQSMRIMIRAANVWEVSTPDGRRVPTPRPAARALFRDLRGPDVGVVRQYTLEARNPQVDLLNAGGNIETLPPYPGFPLGRVVYGTGQRRHPDPAMVRLLDAQRAQPALTVDTSWLLAGHVDEIMHVVRADNARGWTLMVADPRLAVRLMERAAGQHPPARLLAGSTAPHQPEVHALLADPVFHAQNETAARHIEAQVATLLAETGLRPEELVRVPVPFRAYSYGGFPELFRTLSPNLVNGLSLSARHYAAPDPHGPELAGVDLFRQAAEQALARVGVRAHWVENVRWAHLGGGEVHCATNALRTPDRGGRWWLASSR